MKKGLLALLIILMSVGTLAQTNERPKRKKNKETNAHRTQKPFIDDLYLGAGSYTESVGHVQIDENGGTEKFQFNPYFTFGIKNYIFTNQLSWIPEFGIGLPHEGADENTSRWNFHFLSKFTYDVNEYFGLSAGVGLSWVRLSLDGGTQVLQNGNSQDEFPMPEGSSVSQNIILSMGLNAKFDKNWGASADVHVLNIEDELKRTWNYLISVNYFFGKVEFDL